MTTLSQNLEHVDFVDKNIYMTVKMMLGVMVRDSPHTFIVFNVLHMYLPLLVVNVSYTILVLIITLKIVVFTVILVCR